MPLLFQNRTTEHFGRTRTMSIVDNKITLAGMKFWIESDGKPLVLHDPQFVTKGDSNSQETHATCEAYAECVVGKVSCSAAESIAVDLR